MRNIKGIMCFDVCKIYEQKSLAWEACWDLRWEFNFVLVFGFYLAHVHRKQSIFMACYSLQNNKNKNASAHDVRTIIKNLDEDVVFYWELTKNSIENSRCPSINGSLSQRNDTSTSILAICKIHKSHNESLIVLESFGIKAYLRIKYVSVKILLGERSTFVLQKVGSTDLLIPPSSFPIHLFQTS